MLRRLGHVTEAGLVTLKGRAACEIDTADELLTAELLLNGVFNSLDMHQLVALVSCLIPVDKSQVPRQPPPSTRCKRVQADTLGSRPYPIQALQPCPGKYPRT